MGSAKLEGGNQNDKRASVGFSESLPIDIQCSSPMVEGYCKSFGEPKEPSANVREGGVGRSRGQGLGKVIGDSEPANNQG